MKLNMIRKLECLLSYLSCRSPVIENFPLQEGAAINNKVTRKYGDSISESCAWKWNNHNCRTNWKLRKVWRRNKEKLLSFKERERENKIHNKQILHVCLTVILRFTYSSMKDSWLKHRLSTTFSYDIFTWDFVDNKM